MENVIKPNLVDTYLVNGRRWYDVNINITQHGNTYRWEQLTIPSDKFDYSGVVDSLIVYKYPNDKMQAIINNYLLDQNDQQAVNEFNEMQEWRRRSKELAKEILTYELH